MRWGGGVAYRLNRKRAGAEAHQPPQPDGRRCSIATEKLGEGAEEGEVARGSGAKP
jgi:hypothetical protein